MSALVQPCVTLAALVNPINTAKTGAERKLQQGSKWVCNPYHHSRCMQSTGQQVHGMKDLLPESLLLAGSDISGRQSGSNAHLALCLTTMSTPKARHQKGLLLYYKLLLVAGMSARFGGQSLLVGLYITLCPCLASGVSVIGLVSRCHTAILYVAGALKDATVFKGLALTSQC